jgi:cardiolipin synthase (CMP-forming)
MVPDTIPEREISAAPALAARRPRRLELLRNLPNMITLARLMAAPVALWFILHHRYGVAFWVFVGAGFSDALDGWIAKRWNCRTPLGALLDPAADKALIVVVYLSLWHGGHLPGLLVFLVLLRDFLIVLGYLVIQLKGAQNGVGPIYVSKVNTLVQLALVTFVLARLGLGIAAGPVTALLIGAAGLTTVLSGFAYLARWARVLVSWEPTL